MEIGEKKRPLGRPLGRWDDDIKIYFKKTGQQSVKWIDLAQRRNKCGGLVKAVKNPGVAYS